MTERPPQQPEEEWQQFTQGVKPLRKSTRQKPPLKPVSIHIQEKEEAFGGGTFCSRSLITGDVSRLDPKMAKALRKGEIEPEAVLDLHHFRVPEAFEKVREFIPLCLQARLRVVAIITGKGLRGKGVLKAEVPKWLEEMGGDILSLLPAPRNQGGEGTLLVVLRRNRD